MDNDDAKHVLLNVRRMVTAGYPFPKGSDVHPIYAMAFGLIAGLCTEALQAAAQGRKANFVIETSRAEYDVHGSVTGRLPPKE